MADFQDNMTFLTKKVIEYRLKGYTMEETAEKVGVSTEDAVREWKNYTTSRYKMPKEEQWLLHLLRVEHMLTMFHAKIENSTNIEDFEVGMKILDRIEALQSLNLSRKEVAELEAEKVSRLLAEQVIGILEVSKATTQAMIEQAFTQHKTLKGAKEALLTDLGEYTTKALTELEAETVED